MTTSSVDPAGLELLGKLLLERAEDLSWVGTKLKSEAWSANWKCAKAERYRTAMQARATETRRVATQLRELGWYLRTKAAQLSQGAPSA